MRTFLLTAMLLFAASADARGVTFERISQLLKFTYEWPREAAADRRLNARFEAQARGAYREALAGAKENREDLRKQNFEIHFQGYDSSYWETAGQTPRLLSLQSTEEAMSPGMAHPSHANEALLWDRRLQKAVDFEGLFLKPGALARLTRASYCRALDAERHKRLTRVLGADKANGPFDACPEYSDLAIVPVDKNKNGRFDTIAFIAAQDLAGTNPEGEYAIPLPVTRQMIAAIKPVYRASFEPQRQ